MNANSSCPCCSSSMLLHLSSRRSFWLCSHCRLEIPDCDPQNKLNKGNKIKLSAASFKEAIAPLSPDWLATV